MDMSSNRYLEECGNSMWVERLVVKANSPNNGTWSEMSFALQSLTNMQVEEPAM